MTIGCIPVMSPEYHGYIMDMELPSPRLSLSAAHQGRDQDRADHEGIQQDTGDDPRDSGQWSGGGFQTMRIELDIIFRMEIS